MTFTIDQDVPLNDLLLDFIEVVEKMGVKDPQLFRGYDFHKSPLDYEEAMTGNGDAVGIGNDDNYHNASGGSIKEYEDAHTLAIDWGGGSKYGINGRIFLEASKEGKTIKFEPTQELIGGLLAPNLLIEAYLLHLIDRQSKTR